MVHFFSYPYTSNEAKEKVLELASLLTGYCGRLTVNIVPFTGIQEELRRCILEGADRTRFLEAARRASQYVPMLEHAQKLVEEGVSTVDEVIRTLLAL